MGGGSSVNRSSKFPNSSDGNQYIEQLYKPNQPFKNLFRRQNSKSNIITESVGNYVSPNVLAVPCLQTNPSSDYRFTKRIGHGSSSIVHKAVSLSDSHKRVAIKEVDYTKMSKKQLGDLHREMNILSQLSHPGIVQLYSVYVNSSKIYMVLECLRGGELLDVICDREYYTEGDARRIMLQLTAAVDYIHSRGVIHRDIKPENIILESNSIYSNVKLVDFGYSILASDSPSKHSRYMVGTPGYISPEILKDGFYSTAGDNWALGIILYILLSGAMPFDSKNESKILAAKYPLPGYLFSNVSSLAKDLISKILVADPNTRYTALEILYHPWMLLPVNVPDSQTELQTRPHHSFSFDSNESHDKFSSPRTNYSIDKDKSIQSTHKDNDITKNLIELRRLTAQQRWHSAFVKVIASVKQQKLQNGPLKMEKSIGSINVFPHIDHLSMNVAVTIPQTVIITPRLNSGQTSATSSFRTASGTPTNSTFRTSGSGSQLNLVVSPRCGKEFGPFKTNSWHNAGLWYLNQYGDCHDVIHEHDEGEGDEDTVEKPNKVSPNHKSSKSNTPKSKAVTPKSILKLESSARFNFKEIDIADKSVKGDLDYLTNIPFLGDEGLDDFSDMPTSDSFKKASKFSFATASQLISVDSMASSSEPMFDNFNQQQLNRNIRTYSDRYINSSDDDEKYEGSDETRPITMKRIKRNTLIMDDGKLSSLRSENDSQVCEGSYSKDDDITTDLTMIYDIDENKDK